MANQIPKKKPRILSSFIEKDQPLSPKTPNNLFQRLIVESPVLESISYQPELHSKNFDRSRVVEVIDFQNPNLLKIENGIGMFSRDLRNQNLYSKEDFDISINMVQSQPDYQKFKPKHQAKIEKKKGFLQLSQLQSLSLNLRSCNDQILDIVNQQKEKFTKFLTLSTTQINSALTKLNIKCNDLLSKNIQNEATISKLKQQLKNKQNKIIELSSKKPQFESNHQLLLESKKNAQQCVNCKKLQQKIKENQSSLQKMQLKMRNQEQQNQSLQQNIFDLQQRIAGIDLQVEKRVIKQISNLDLTQRPTKAQTQKLNIIQELNNQVEQLQSRCKYYESIIIQQNQLKERQQKLIEQQKNRQRKQASLLQAMNRIDTLSDLNYEKQHELMIMQENLIKQIDENNRREQELNQRQQRFNQKPTLNIYDENLNILSDQSFGRHNKNKRLRLATQNYQADYDNQLMERTRIIKNSNNQPRKSQQPYIPNLHFRERNYDKKSPKYTYDSKGQNDEHNSSRVMKKHDDFVSKRQEKYDPRLVRLQQKIKERMDRSRDVIYGSKVSSTYNKDTKINRVKSNGYGSIKPENKDSKTRGTLDGHLDRLRKEIKREIASIGNNLLIS